MLLDDKERYPNLTKLPVGVDYDAIWAMALGLHNASERVRMNDSSGCGHLPGKLVPLEQFDYWNQMMGCVLQRSIAEVHFIGITVSSQNQTDQVMVRKHILLYIIHFTSCYRERLHSMKMEAEMIITTYE